MKLGLLGYPIEHSLSPKLYAEFLGDKLSSYEKFSFDDKANVPDLSFFANKLDGLNITAPYKTHFVPDIEIPSELIQSLGIVNTLAFIDGKTLGTNTDLLAVVDILKNYQTLYPKLKIVLLGDGSMAKVTKIVANDLDIKLLQLSRKDTPDFDSVDLRKLSDNEYQTLIINSCSRDYVFKGDVTGNEVFWDYNYSFLPHQNTLPTRVKSYVDGREMLELQAREAIKFWFQVNPKLK